jgi:hypothetical protein
MSAERDTTRIVRSWLRTDEHESADRVLDNVFALLDATPQRRSRWPARRIADMNPYTKIVIGAAAVLVVAVIGINMLPVGGGVGRGPAPTPTPVPSTVPTPSPSPTVSPSPTPAADVFPPIGPLETGKRHAISREGVPFSLTVPTPEWTSNGMFAIDRSGGFGPLGAGFIFWSDTPVGIFTDPCAGQKGPELGTSVSDLAAAIAAIPGTVPVSGPTDVTVGGYPAKKVVIRIPHDIGCDAMSFDLWYAPTPGLGRYATAAGSTIRTWIIDVNGTPVWIDGETFEGAGLGPGREIQQVIDSIEFD